MIANRLLKAAAIALLVSSCVMSEYKDVSAAPAYRNLVGQRLETTSPTLLHAVTLDRNYAKHVDSCTIQPPPGFTGPELIYRRSMPAGTTFQVLAVRECTNCPIDDRVELILSPEDSGLSCGAAPITINLNYLRSSVPLLRNIPGSTPNNSFKPKPLRGSA
jgi:hypothetical protein